MTGDNNNTRKFSYTDTVLYNGNLYPTTKINMNNGSGMAESVTMFTDKDGQYYTLGKDGKVYNAILQQELPAVEVTAPRSNNLLDNILKQGLLVRNDKTLVSKFPYRENVFVTNNGIPLRDMLSKPQPNPRSSISPKVQDNVFTRVLSYLIPKENYNSYHNSLSPYTYQDDLAPNGKISQGLLTTGNEKASKLGELGLVKVGNNQYKLYDEYGNTIKQCAKTRNEIEKMLGHPTTNNAWDTFGVYGDSTLFNGYPSKTGPFFRPSYIVQNQIAADRTQKALENLQLQTGDVVDLYNPFSHYAEQAYKQGTLNRSNSHTGVIFQPYPGVKSKTYIIHNVNGNISVDPIGSFLLNADNPFPKWRPTGFHRPGTKEHPYLNNGKPTHK